MNETRPDPLPTMITRRRMLALSGAFAFMPFCARGADEVEPAESPTTPAKEKKKEPPKDPYGDAVLVDGEPPLPQDGAFTFAVLPDTQHYSEKFPETYVA